MKNVTLRILWGKLQLNGPGAATGGARSDHERDKI